MAIDHQDPSDKKLTVLCFSEHYFPLVGGTVTYVDNICENLARLGHHVFLITYTNLSSPNANKWTKHNSYSVFYLGLPDNIRYDSRQARNLFLSLLAKRLPDLINEIEPDILHILYGHYLPKVIGIYEDTYPIIWTIQNVPPREYGSFIITPFKPINNLITRIYFSAVKFVNARKFRNFHYETIIVSSEHTQKLVIETGVSSDKIALIPNGVDENLYFPKNDLHTPNSSTFPLILCVAGIIKHKGQLNMVRAMKKILLDYPTAKFINIGPTRDKTYADEINTEINRLSLKQSCVFLPPEQNVTKLLDFLHLCDIYVQPSLEEGFCMAILEAVCCGKPVVGTNTGAIPEIIKTAGQNNLCPINDSGCLADKIILTAKKLHNPEIDHFRQYQNIVLKYSWQSVARKTAILYQIKIKS